MEDRVERMRSDRGRPRWVDTGSGPGYEDMRPAFDPMMLVVAVQRLLRERGIAVEVGDAQIYVSMIAAADLLRALGVRPEQAPMERPR